MTPEEKTAFSFGFWLGAISGAIGVTLVWLITGWYMVHFSIPA